MTRFRCDDCGRGYYTAATDAVSVYRMAGDGCQWCGGTLSNDLRPPHPLPAGGSEGATDGALARLPEPGIAALPARSAAHRRAAGATVQKRRYSEVNDHD